MNKTLAVVSQSGETINFFNIEDGKCTGQVENLIPEPHEVAYDDRSNLLYVTHAYRHGWYAQHGEACAEVSVIDCGRREVVDVMDIGPHRGPHGIFLDTHRDLLYVSTEEGLEDNGGPGGIVGINIKTREVVKAVGAGWKVHWFVLTPDGKKVFTCNKEAGFISVLDMEQEKMVGKIDLPGGCEAPAISNDGKLAYFPSPTIALGMRREGKPGDFHIQVIDTATCELVRAVPLEFGAVALGVDPMDRLFVGQYRTSGASAEAQLQEPMPGELSVLDPGNGFQKLASFQTDSVPLNVCAAPVGSRAFAANIFAGTVSVLNLDEMKKERSIEVDILPREDKLLHQGAHEMALIP
ncbi:cell surface [Lecanosticta acicola]|uniref:Cell surface n=1 Tax=Lecanosticta acicola TaxID=111012 RepID=A0AAI8Z884_9PEZI|nr:cell surface [Lecanosticta acicola]